MKFRVERPSNGGQALEIRMISGGIQNGIDEKMELQRIVSGLTGIPLHGILTIGVDEQTGEHMIIARLRAASAPQSTLTSSLREGGEYLN